MKVYYAFDDNVNISKLAYLEIENLYSDLLERYKQDEDIKKYLRCYAAIKDLKNTFIVKSPVDFNVFLDHETKNIFCDKGDDFLASYFDITKGSIQIGQQLYLFSEESLTVTQLPPYLHDVPYNEYYGVTGSFDISKWFRPIVPGLISKNLNSKNNNISVKRGDPLYYIKFNTDKDIELINYSMNENLIKYSLDCFGYKNFVYSQKLEKLYNVFMNKKYNKKIIREIRKELE
jgi:hypothetical protein